MLSAEILSFREFVMHESLPLAKIRTAVLEFLQGRGDAVLFGAQAVNACVDEPRATQGVDIISNRAAAPAEELRDISVIDFASPCGSGKSRAVRACGFIR
ncbi:MAG: hypothetical protein ABIR33_01405 [Pyrinomonadaceae bacterium]